MSRSTRLIRSGRHQPSPSGARQKNVTNRLPGLACPLAICAYPSFHNVGGLVRVPKEDMGSAPSGASPLHGADAGLH
jgi:hypothetical protein